MKRALLICISAALTATLVGSTVSAASTDSEPKVRHHNRTALVEAKLTMAQRHHLVRYQGLEHVDWSVRENQLTIRAAFHHFGMSDGIAQCVASRESGFNNDAVNEDSNPRFEALGLFQFIRRYWHGRVSDYNAHVTPAFKVKHDWANARANALVAAWMVKTGGWGPWGGGC